MTEQTYRLHEDAPLFREAVNFTAAQTGFLPRLIEKDYFCAVLLSRLVEAKDLVFKGGTCLAKVHAGFYRLSEDLDFTIPMAVNASRSDRRRAVESVKNSIAHIAEHQPVFSPSTPLTGANNSTQYNGVVEYRSLVTDESESILVEVSLREPLLTPTFEGLANTMLLSPITARPMLQPLPVVCISRLEAMAEKFRAALTRREVAIRDFFDIDYAVRNWGLDATSHELIEIVRQKITIPGNAEVDVSPERMVDLARQVDARLRPVLRDDDIKAFDLSRAIKHVTCMAESIAGI